MFTQQHEHFNVSLGGSLESTLSDDKRGKFRTFVQVKLYVNICLKKRHTALHINNSALLSSDAIC